MQLVIGTLNRSKIKEIAEILKDIPVQLMTPENFSGISAPVENGRDFFENAAKKARHYASAAGCWAVADDSGLEVDALGGRPGMLSSRYAGEDGNSRKNIEKLLGELQGVPGEKRTARFKCVIALSSPDGAVFTFEGVCEGRITETPQGDGGFGYDPVFYYEPFGRTFAQATLEEKNRVSHRGQALKGFAEFLKNTLV